MSTDTNDFAQLLIFIRGVNKNLSISEELLDLFTLKGTTTGIDIFRAVSETMDKFELKFRNL